MTHGNTLSELLTDKLLSPTFSGPTGKTHRFGFRGELGLKFPPSIAGEKRPPEIKADQVILAAEGDSIVFFAGHVDSLAHLGLIVDTLRSGLTAAGRYFIFAGNVDLSKKYAIEVEGFPFYVLPLDEATVYNEVLDLLYLDRGDLKRMSGEGKIDAIVDAASTFAGRFPAIAYDQALAEMGPVKVADNRPV